MLFVNNLCSLVIVKLGLVIPQNHRGGRKGRVNATLPTLVQARVLELVIQDLQALIKY